LAVAKRGNAAKKNMADAKDGPEQPAPQSLSCSGRCETLGTRLGPWKVINLPRAKDLEGYRLWGISFVLSKQAVKHAKNAWKNYCRNTTFRVAICESFVINKSLFCSETTETTSQKRKIWKMMARSGNETLNYTKGAIVICT